MNQFSDRSQSPDNPNVFADARLSDRGNRFEPPRAKKTGCWWIGGLLFGFMLLGAIALVAVTLGPVSGGLDIDDPNAMRSVDHSTRYEKSASSFDNPNVDESDKDYRKIRQTIDVIMKASLNEDPERVFSKIDASAFVAQMERSGEYPGMLWSDKFAIKRDFKEIMDGPEPFNSFEIVNIQPINDFEKLVYLHAWDAPDQGQEFRYWMVRRNDDWKLADWESIQFGQSSAENYAILCAHQQTRGVKNFYRLYEQQIELFELIGDDKLDEARDLLTNFETWNYHSDLKGNAFITLGFLRTYIDDWELAAEHFRRVPSGKETPGKHYGLALCHVATGEYGAALKEISEFSKYVGNSPNVEWIRSECLEELDRHDEALDAWFHIAKMQPDAYVHSGIQRLAPYVSVDKIEQGLRSFDDPEAKALEAINSSYGNRPENLLTAALAIVKDSKPGIADFVQGIQESQQYNYPKAVASFERATQAAKDDEELLRIYDDRRRSLLIDMGELEKAYQTSANKDSAFDDIVYAYDDEVDIDPEALLNAVAAREKDAPQDPWVHYYRGSALQDLKREEEALASFQKAAEVGKGGDQDADEGLQYAANSARYEIDSILTKQGRGIEAYEQSSDKETSFSTISNILHTAGDISALKELCDVRRSEDPEDPNLAMASARIALANHEYGHAVDAIRDLEFDSEEDGGYYYNSLSSQRDQLLAECQVSNNTWQQALKDSQQFEESRRASFFQQVLAAAKGDSDPYKVEHILHYHKSSDMPLADRIGEELSNATGERLQQLLADHRMTEWPDQQYSRRTWALRGIRSLLRQNELAAARQLAIEMSETSDDAYGLLLYFAHRGDLANCIEVLNENKDDRTWLDQLRSERVARAFVDSAAFQQVPVEHKIWIRGYASTYMANVLLTDQKKINFSDLVHRVESKTMKANTDSGSLKTLEIADAIAAATIRVGEVDVLLLQVPAPTVGIEAAHANLQPLLDKHESTLSICVLDPEFSKQDLTVALKIASLFKDDHNCVGIQLPRESQFLPAPFDGLQPSDPRCIHRIGVEEDFTVFDFSDSTEWWRQQKVNLARLAELRDNPKGSRVRVDIPIAGVHLPHWFQVLSIEDDAGSITLEVVPEVKNWFTRGTSSERPGHLNLRTVNEWHPSP